MLFNVRMTAQANHDNIPIKKVYVPDDKIEDLAFIDERLELIFHYGQVEFELSSPDADRDLDFYTKLPSVSVGDVIEIENRLFQVATIGFREISEDRFRQLMELPQTERIIRTIG